MPSETWYDDATVYALDVKRFADSDGDGVGDFGGLTDGLDHLDDLGVSAVWLLPFYPSPGRDNGYDVADYRDVDPRLGTLAEFETFVEAAHDRDIRVLTDLVVNHTSDEHPWFRAAREDPDSKYRDYYVWADEPRTAAADGGTTCVPEGGSMFPGEVSDGRIWTFDEAAGAYYYHRFYPFQPELNVSNPAVQREIEEIIEFWLARGVDGFRVDAATLLIQPKSPEAATRADPHDLLRELKAHATDHDPDSVLLAEADDAPERLDNYVEDGGVDSLLNFLVGASMFAALAEERSAPLAEAFDSLPDLSAGRWGNFLRNHDELNLARLSDERRDAVFEAFAPDEEMRIYGRGIRRRLAPMLDGDRERLELAYSLLFSLPGTPVLYYGDELGMGEDLSLSGRTAVRTPMQWNDGPNGGFSTAEPADLVAPVISDDRFGYERVNAAAQAADEGSLFNWLSDLVAVRSDCGSLGAERCRVLAADDSAFVHRFDHGTSSLVCVHNLGASPASVDLRRADLPTGSVESVFGLAEVEDDGDAVSVTLGRYGYAWLRVGDEE